MTVADEISIIFSEKGSSSYFGEPVSQLEHALQAAHFASREQAPDRLVLAALLHDIGHLVEDTPENIADLGIDAMHEKIGELWLAERFGPEVFEPVYLHVSAKRYLCATDPDYFSRLSPASVQALGFKVGRCQRMRSPYSKVINTSGKRCASGFGTMKAKVPGLATADLAHYRILIEQGSVSK